MITYQVDLICDQCGAIVSAEPNLTSFGGKSAAWRTASEHGWTSNDDQLWCPNCSPSKKTVTQFPGGTPLAESSKTERPPAAGQDFANLTPGPNNRGGMHDPSAHSFQPSRPIETAGETALRAFTVSPPGPKVPLVDQTAAPTDPGNTVPVGRQNFCPNQGPARATINAPFPSGSPIAYPHGRWTAPDSVLYVRHLHEWRRVGLPVGGRTSTPSVYPRRAGQPSCADVLTSTLDRAPADADAVAGETLIQAPGRGLLPLLGGEGRGEGEPPQKEAA